MNKFINIRDGRINVTSYRPANCQATTLEDLITRAIAGSDDYLTAVQTAVQTMESYLSDSEIQDMIVCDQCTLTAEYRPQLTADLERLYDSLDNHDKGVLQDQLDDMWIMYCIARYTDKGACSGQQRGL